MSTTAHAFGSEPASQTPSTPTFEELAKRVDDATAALQQLDPAARAVADELKDAIEAVHRVGLVTIVRRLRSEESTRSALYDLVDEPVVHLLFSLHEIVRPDPTTQANRVLQAVRPALHSHGGDVSLGRIENGTAFVHLQGACNGCSMSSVTLRNLVETALVEGVSSVTAVEVLPNEPEPTLIPADSLFANRPATGGWVDAGSARDILGGEIATMSLTEPTSGNDVSVIVVNIDQRLSAYVNECAHEAMPLDNAILDVSNGTLTCPWHGFCYDAASGECLSSPGAQLEQLPLRIDGERFSIRVAT